MIFEQELAYERLVNGRVQESACAWHVPVLGPLAARPAGVPEDAEPLLARVSPRVLVSSSHRGYSSQKVVVARGQYHVSTAVKPPNLAHQCAPRFRCVGREQGEGLKLFFTP